MKHGTGRWFQLSSLAGSGAGSMPASQSRASSPQNAFAITAELLNFILNLHYIYLLLLKITNTGSISLSSRATIPNVDILLQPPRLWILRSQKRKPSLLRLRQIPPTQNPIPQHSRISKSMLSQPPTSMSTLPWTILKPSQSLPPIRHTQSSLAPNEYSFQS